VTNSLIALQIFFSACGMMYICSAFSKKIYMYKSINLYLPVIRALGSQNKFNLDYWQTFSYYLLFIITVCCIKPTLIQFILDIADHVHKLDIKNYVTSFSTTPLSPKNNQHDSPTIFILNQLGMQLFSLMLLFLFQTMSNMIMTSSK